VLLAFCLYLEVCVEKKNRAVFLDRDGTINVEKGYLHRIEDFAFIPGAPQAIRMLKDAGFLVIVITNQSGIARGYYPVRAVSRLHEHMDDELARFGASIDAYYVCPHHPQGSVEEYAKACDCRKPLPGMLLEAARKFSINMDCSYMIGDKAVDVETGLQAGCRPVLVRTGYGAGQSSGLPVGVPCYDDLLDAAKAIVAGKCGDVQRSTFNVLR
jgi:D-glycero-D-manno-heptose 1,7-bisphosphate phosphatase